jgi:hypothetical protein
MAPGLLRDPIPCFETHAWGQACREEGAPGQLLGWPTRLTGDLVWTGSQFRAEEEYVYHLTEAERIEIGSALAHFNGIASLSLHTFSISRLFDAHSFGFGWK